MDCLPAGVAVFYPVDENLRLVDTIGITAAITEQGIEVELSRLAGTYGAVGAARTAVSRMSRVTSKLHIAYRVV